MSISINENFHMVSETLHTCSEDALPVITAGDSKAGQLALPKQFMKALKRWLESQFDGNWTDRKKSLKVGIQFDANSCGICAINCIAHAIFRDRLWEQKRAAIERAEWFAILAKRHMDDVRALYLIIPINLCSPA